MSLPKILEVKEDVKSMRWMNHMPVPLKPGQKVIVDNEQVGCDGRPLDNRHYVRVKHGGVVSVFSRSYFKFVKTNSVN